MKLSELEEIQFEAYDSVRLSKKKAKFIHDRMILRKNFIPGLKVLLFDSRIYLFPGEHRPAGWVLLLLLM